MSMNPDRYQKIRDIFEHVCDVPLNQRDDVLDDLCEQDLGLRSEVCKLLAMDANMGDEFDSVNFLPPAIDDHEHIKFPDSIGAYTINGILGRGGSSVVYEATQKNPARSVALKVIHTRSMDENSIRRFEKEAQIMGQLSHPCIAKVYESGIVEGRHGLDRFIAIELVRGMNIVKFMRSHSLKTNQKISLFLDLCNAMQYAHEQGVIHRDLKPDNIFVTDAGHLKVLDFGIARFSSQNTDITTMHTQAGQLIGTLAFMSPEQVKGEAHELDERSDVYALGVVLFQLLVDKLPYNLEQLSYFQAAKLIEDTIPARLSTINTKMRGDLDTILAQALERDPSRRYGSVLALQEDLSRYLRNEPINARPASAWYHARQFVRRHKGFSAGLAIACLAIMFGFVAVSIALSRAIESKNIALQESSVSEAITSFLLEDLIGQADTRSSTDRELTVAQALDISASQIDDRFVDLPLVEAEIRKMIGRTYVSLGSYEQAEPELIRAVELFTTHHGEDHPSTLLAQEELGVLYSNTGRHQEAKELQLALLESRKWVLGEHDLATLRTMNDLALLYTHMGMYAESKAMHTDVLDIRMELLGDKHFDTQLSMHNLGLTMLYLGEPKQAAELYERLIPQRVALLGEEHPATLLSMNNLAGAYRGMKMEDKMHSLHKRVDAIQMRTLGLGHPNTLRTKANIGSSLIKSDPDQAGPYLEQAYEGRLETLGPDHQETMHSQYLLAYLAFKNGQLESAHDQLLAISENQLSILGPDHRDTKTTLKTLKMVDKALEE